MRPLGIFRSSYEGLGGGRVKGLVDRGSPGWASEVAFALEAELAKDLGWIPERTERLDLPPVVEDDPGHLLL